MGALKFYPVSKEFKLGSAKKIRETTKQLQVIIIVKSGDVKNQLGLNLHILKVYQNRI